MLVVEMELTHWPTLRIGSPLATVTIDSTVTVRPYQIGLALELVD